MTKTTDAGREAVIRQICDDFEEHPSFILCRALFDAGAALTAADHVDLRTMMAVEAGQRDE